MFLSIDTIHFFTKPYSHSYLSGLWALSWHGIIPEKAIADYLYLESGEWDSSRMESMRGEGMRPIRPKGWCCCEIRRVAIGEIYPRSCGDWKSHPRICPGQYLEEPP